MVIASDGMVAHSTKNTLAAIANAEMYPTHEAYKNMVERIQLDGEPMPDNGFEVC